jgi:hypothetical protein
MIKIAKNVFLFFLVTAGTSLLAQSKLDKIKKLNGEEIEVEITATDQKMVSFKYPGENETYRISKRMIQEITHKSGRKEKLSEALVIKGEEDWEKVMITQDKDDVEGMVKKGETTEGTKGFSLHSASSSDKKATKKLRQEADPRAWRQVGSRLQPRSVALASDAQQPPWIDHTTNNDALHSRKRSRRRGHGPETSPSATRDEAAAAGIHGGHPAPLVQHSSRDMHHGEQHRACPPGPQRPSRATRASSSAGVWPL